MNKHKRHNVLTTIMAASLPTVRKRKAKSQRPSRGVDICFFISKVGNTIASYVQLHLPKLELQGKHYVVHHLLNAFFLMRATYRHNSELHKHSGTPFISVTNILSGILKTKVESTAKSNTQIVYAQPEVNSTCTEVKYQVFLCTKTKKEEIANTAAMSTFFTVVFTGEFLHHAVNRRPFKIFLSVNLSTVTSQQQLSLKVPLLCSGCLIFRF